MKREFLFVLSVLVGCAKAPAREPPTFTTLDVGSAGAARTLETSAVDGRDAPRPTLQWASDPEAALAEAVHHKRGLLLVFCAAWSAACHELDATFLDAGIQGSLAARFVTARVDMTDDDAPEVTRRAQTFAVHGLPTIIVFDRSGREVGRVEAYVNARDLAKVLDRVR